MVLGERIKAKKKKGTVRYISKELKSTLEIRYLRLTRRETHSRHCPHFFSPF